MKKLYMHDLSVYTGKRLSVIISISLIVIWAFGVHYMAFILFILLCITLTANYYNSIVISYVDKLRRFETLSTQRLLLIRHLIDLAYTYGADTEMFYKKFCDHICKKQLKNELMAEAIWNFSNKRPNLHSLSSNDMEFMSLLSQGFTYRELSVIYKLSNPNSIYIKSHRLRRKLRGDKCS